jgi:hypothetical protein
MEIWGGRKLKDGCFCSWCFALLCLGMPAFIYRKEAVCRIGRGSFSTPCCLALASLGSAGLARHMVPLLRNRRIRNRTVQIDSSVTTEKKLRNSMCVWGIGDVQRETERECAPCTIGYSRPLDH